MEEFLELLKEILEELPHAQLEDTNESMYCYPKKHLENLLDELSIFFFKMKSWRNSRSIFWKIFSDNFEKFCGGVWRANLKYGTISTPQKKLILQ